MTVQSLQAAHPGAFVLDPADLAGLETYLHARLWIAPWARVQRVERAGDGNMNLSLRVATTTGSFVIKQGRPWVEKYPQIPAPWGRTAVEGLCYEIVRDAPAVGRRVPALIGMDETSQVLAVEDLGPAADFTDLYQGGRVAREDLTALAEWLAALHGLPVPDGRRATLANRAMRALNHEYIFVRPLESGEGPDLDAICSGLERLAADLRREAALADRAAALGRRYLADGDRLVHGDFFPGSWLRGTDGPWIIDFEFAFLGEPEFDLGVMAAHLHLTGQPPALVAHAFDAYAARRPFDRLLASQYAGVEIVRRLIGVAQLPLSAGLDERRDLLTRARALLRRERDAGG